MKLESLERKRNQIGDILSGYEVGKSYGSKCILVKCEYCGKERWVKYDKKRQNRWCRACYFKANNPNLNQRGVRNHRWKGGRIYHNQGYINILLQEDDFFFPMRNSSNYVLEHRLVIAKSLGRCLQPWEIVHHKNGKRDDNRLKNLQLVTDDRHKQITILETKIKYLEAKVKELTERKGGA